MAVRRYNQAPGRALGAQMVDRSQLKAWLTSVTGDLRDVEERLASIEVKRTELARRAALIRELLGEEQAVEQPVAGAAQFREALKAVLVEARRPLHLDEIRAELAKGSIEIPGKGADANIITHLRRVPGVVRAAKGTYVFDESGQTVDVRPSARKPRKRRGIRRVKAASQRGEELK